MALPLAVAPYGILRHAARLLPAAATARTAGARAPAFLTTARRHFQAEPSATPSPSSAAPGSSHESSTCTTNNTTSNNDNNNNSKQSFSTVNQAEISHFDALASTWWDPHGPSRLLHLMNPLRHDFIRECRASAARPQSPAGTTEQQQKQRERHQQPPPSPGLRYLDIGCGGGIFAESAARLPGVSSVAAIDASAAVLDVARAHLRRESPAVQRRLTYLHSSVEALAAGLGLADRSSSSSSPGSAAVPHPASPPPPPPPQARRQDHHQDAGGQQQQQEDDDPRYDVVTTFEVLEHVSSPGHFLSTASSLVRPGGWLVLSTMARTWVSWATTILAAEDVLGIVPRGTHDWRKYVDPDELGAWFASRPAEEGWGGAVVRVQGVVYVPSLGWKVVPGSEKVGNYFFAVRKSPDAR